MEARQMEGVAVGAGKQVVVEEVAVVVVVVVAAMVEEPGRDLEAEEEPGREVVIVMSVLEDIEIGFDGATA